MLIARSAALRGGLLQHQRAAAAAAPLVAKLLAAQQQVSSASFHSSAMTKDAAAAEHSSSSSPSSYSSGSGSGSMRPRTIAVRALPNGVSPVSVPRRRSQLESVVAHLQQTYDPAEGVAVSQSVDQLVDKGAAIWGRTGPGGHPLLKSRMGPLDHYSNAGEPTVRRGRGGSGKLASKGLAAETMSEAARLAGGSMRGPLRTLLSASAHVHVSEQNGRTQRREANRAIKSLRKQLPDLRMNPATARAAINMRHVVLNAQEELHDVIESDSSVDGNRLVQLIEIVSGNNLVSTPDFTHIVDVPSRSSIGSGVSTSPEMEKSRERACAFNARSALVQGVIASRRVANAWSNATITSAVARPSSARTTGGAAAGTDGDSIALAYAAAAADVATVSQDTILSVKRSILESLRASVELDARTADNNNNNSGSSEAASTKGGKTSTTTASAGNSKGKQQQSAASSSSSARGARK